jgi:hypothetical protein
MKITHFAAALLATPLLLAPLAAHASCAGRATTGTVVGGVGGALIGNSISHGGGGAILGGLGGAVLGHEVAKGGCRDGRYAGRDNYRYHHRVRYNQDRYNQDRYNHDRYTHDRDGRRVAVDQYGNPM